MSEQFLIGWAEVSITPDRPVLLAGQFYERVSEYVETPVTVTAMALEAHGTRLVICSCDLSSVDVGLLKAVRENVCSKSDLMPQEIILAATHNHTSLKYKFEENRLKGGLAVMERYSSKPEPKSLSDELMSETDALNFLTERISKAVLDAWSARVPSKIAAGFGRAAIGMCRRAVYDDKSAKMWGDTNSPNFLELECGNDSGIELLYTFDENDTLTGVVATVACPAQILEHRRFISSDYWGKVKNLLRKRFGERLFVLGLCAPAGDQCPRDLIRWVNPETPIEDPNIKRENYIPRDADPSMFDISGTWKAGKRIANEIIDAYEEIREKQENPIFKHKAFVLELPLRRVTLQQVQEAKSVLDTFSNRKDRLTADESAAIHAYVGILERFEVQQKYNLSAVELHVFRIGDLGFATNPFELFLDYGNRIRARSLARQTFLIQLACGSEGYLPTKKAEEGGHYSAYVASGFTGHEGGNLLVRKTLDELNSLMRL